MYTCTFVFMYTCTFGGGKDRVACTEREGGREGGGGRERESEKREKREKEKTFVC